MKGETIVTICARHAAEIAAFRKRCKHRHVEQRIVEWAPGHTYQGKVCARCGRIISSTASAFEGTLTLTNSGGGIVWVNPVKRK